MSAYLNGQKVDVVFTDNANIEAIERRLVEATQELVEEAKQSAEASANTKTEIETFVTQAQGFAKSAEQSRNETQGFAESAEQSRNEAQDFAESAEQSRNEAQGFATDARTSADEAKGYAESINKGLYANALKGNANAANALRIDDVSPIPHNIDVKTSSKNILDLTSVIGMEKTDGTATIKCLADGGITGSGTPSSAISFSNILITEFEYNASYIFSVSGEFTGIRGDIQLLDENENIITIYTINNDDRKKTFTIPSEVKCLSIDVKRHANGIEISGTAYFQIEKGTTATAYTQCVSDISAITVNRFGKNLFNNDASLIKKLTFTNSTNGVRERYGYELHLPVGTYTISTTPKEKTSLTGVYIYGYVLDENGIIVSGKNIHMVALEQCKTFKLPIDVGETLIIANASADGTLETTKMLFSNFNILIEVGKLATKYEPFVESIEYSVSADGTVEGVTSLYPTTTLLSDTDGVVIEVDYNRDINKAYESQQAEIAELEAMILELTTKLPTN